MGNMGNDVEVAILLTATSADKVRFFESTSFEDVTDQRKNTLSTSPRKRNEIKMNVFKQLLCKSIQSFDKILNSF